MASATTNPDSAAELFALRDDAGPILYAPLGQLVARVNEPAAQCALAYAADPSALAQMSADGRAVVNELAAHGFFDERPLPRGDGAFRPVQVTLFPTNRCNLRCSYCYAFGGEGGASGEPLVEMDPAVARAAISLVARNARALADEGRGVRSFVVSVHGNGEPFCAFGLMRKIVRFGHEAAERVGIPVVFNTATNGVLTDEQLAFVVEHFDSVNFSFDGLPAFQDANRPTAGGDGSFAAIDRSMRTLQDAGVAFGIRTTVTAGMVGRMADIVAFVADHYPAAEQIHFEPVWECGRCVTSAEAAPSAAAFTEGYRAALAVARERRMRLVYSGARQDMVCDAFCKAGSGGFTVTPAGDVTACYEVSYASDPRSLRFFFGRYDAQAGGFAFDEEKLAALAQLNVRNYPYCRDCFCKWHCAGDCAAKVLDGKEPQAHAGSSRCEVNRALTLDQIRDMLDRSPSKERGEPDGR